MTDRYDFILEAGHFDQSGQLEFARLYERRDSSYSDRVIYTRQMLLEALKKNKKVAIGSRVKRLASTFNISAPVILSSSTESHALVTPDHSSAQTDKLTGLPVI